MEIQVLAISVITDLCDHENLEILTLEQVLSTARSAGPKLAELLAKVLPELN